MAEVRVSCLVAEATLCSAVEGARGLSLGVIASWTRDVYSTARQSPVVTRSEERVSFAKGAVTSESIQVTDERRQELRERYLLERDKRLRGW